MITSMLLVLVCIFYGMIWFFDSFFKSCMHYPYHAFLDGTGLKVGVFYFSWRTTVFNRYMFQWSQRGTRFLRRWFNLGTMLTISLVPFGILVLVISGFTYINNSSSKFQEPMLQPVVPGVNLPSSDHWHYLISIIICSVIHEFGHALAAVQEDVQLVSAGFFVAFIFPVALVDLNANQLNVLEVWRKFRILCAGVWHNIVCGIVAYLLLFMTPILFSVLYKHGHGIEVQSIHTSSPLSGPRGFHKYDIITSLNGCRIKDKADWAHCLSSVMSDRFGLCVSADLVAKYDESVKINYRDDNIVNCCAEDNVLNLCFEYMESPHPGDSYLEQYSCLSPRSILQDSGLRQCYEADHYKCPKDLFCLKPLLHNLTYLMIFEGQIKDRILYIGHPSDVHSTVYTSQYIPRRDLFQSNIPEHFEKLMRYIVMFSFGLAVINIIPCYGFDGHHITRNLVYLVSKRFNKSNNFIEGVTMCIIFIGTAITFPILLYGFINTIFYS